MNSDIRWVGVVICFNFRGRGDYFASLPVKALNCARKVFILGFPEQALGLVLRFSVLGLGVWGLGFQSWGLGVFRFGV